MTESKPPTSQALIEANGELDEALQLCQDSNSGLTEREKFYLRHEKAMAVLDAALAEIECLQDERRTMGNDRL